MRVRYKEHPHIVRSASQFNMSSINEVLTGDDSVPESELDVLINNQWIDMREAFRQHLLITDNYMIHFFEPQTEEDRERGYTL